MRGHGTARNSWDITRVEPGREILAMWNWKAIDVVNAHVRRMSLLTEVIAYAGRRSSSTEPDSGRLDTDRMPLDRLDEALELLERKPNGFVKAVVTMDGRRT